MNRLFFVLLLVLGVYGESFPPYPNCSNAFPKQNDYNVTVIDVDGLPSALPNGAPLLSYLGGTSVFNFSFNSAWFPAPDSVSGVEDGLVVRNVECNANHHPCPEAKHPEWTNAGALAVIKANLSKPIPWAESITYSEVQWPGCAPPPPSTTAEWGAADPRMTYRPSNKMYYLTWDNCTQNCYPSRTTLLSTTTNPFDPSAWTLHGPVLPGVYTAGASLLFRDDAGGPPHYAFVADSDTANDILLAESDDGITWKQPANESKRIFMSGRPNCWDKAVAVGAQPERLSTGDYLLIYNIDTGYPYKKNPLGRCAIGWAVLDKDDPTVFVARSSEPLLIATLPWEQCPDKNYTCQETMVVFTSGMKPLGNDAFLILFGGGDTDVGAVRIQVDIRTKRNN